MYIYIYYIIFCITVVRNYTRKVKSALLRRFFYHCNLFSYCTLIPLFNPLCSEMLEHSPPRLHESPAQTEALEGKPASLTCVGEGNPPPTYR